MAMPSSVQLQPPLDLDLEYDQHNELFAPASEGEAQQRQPAEAEEMEEARQNTGESFAKRRRGRPRGATRAETLRQQMVAEAAAAGDGDHDASHADGPAAIPAVDRPAAHAARAARARWSARS